MQEMKSWRPKVSWLRFCDMSTAKASDGMDILRDFMFVGREIMSVTLRCYGWRKNSERVTALTRAFQLLRLPFSAREGLTRILAPFPGASTIREHAPPGNSSRSINDRQGQCRTNELYISSAGKEHAFRQFASCTITKSATDYYKSVIFSVLILRFW